MTDKTDSTDNQEHIDVKKVRAVPSPCFTEGDISIEQGLRDIFQATNNALSYLNIACAIGRDDSNEFIQDDGGDALQLMLVNANETISTAWQTVYNLANALGVNVHAKQEEDEEVAA